MRRVVVLVSLVVVGVLSLSVAGQQQERMPLPDLQQVRDNLYVIMASSPVDRSKFTGGNTGVFIMETGVLIVDTKLAGYGPSIIQKIRAVTDKPVTTIVNTHTHGDHVGSNEAFPVSVEIVAHENTKANMAKSEAFQGEKAQFLPDRTYTDALSLFSGDDRVDLYHFGPGHTNGDTLIFYPALKVLQTGDIFPWLDAPFIDRNNGGSGVELPDTLSKALAAIRDVDIVVPGHMPVTNLAGMRQYQEYTADLLAAARSAMAAGTSAEAAAKDIATTLGAKYSGYRSDRVQAAVEAIYAELGG